MRSSSWYVVSQGKDPQITEEFIEPLLFTQKDAKQAFSILALLAPNLDYKNGNSMQITCIPPPRSESEV
jgi:hypothetical protein